MSEKRTYDGAGNRDRSNVRHLPARKSGEVIEFPLHRVAPPANDIKSRGAKEPGAFVRDLALVPDITEAPEAPRRSKLGRLIRRVGAVTLAGAAIAVFVNACSSEPEYEKRAEACVSDLVGREVNLVEQEFGGGLQAPREVIDEFSACIDADYESDIARQNIRRIPLD